MPWYHSDSTIYDDGCPQYSHMFYSDCEPCSSFWEHIKPVVSQLSPLGLTRVKFNATPRTPEIVESPLHYDVIDQDDKPVDVKICILYMNDNDGYTYFEDGSKVESKANMDSNTTLNPSFSTMTASGIIHLVSLFVGISLLTVINHE